MTRVADGQRELRQIGAGGAILALILGLFLPALVMMGINDNTSDRAELLCYVCYLSSIYAFVLAGRRPLFGAVWLLIVGAICGAWMYLQLQLPPRQPFGFDSLLTPLFWPADLPFAGGLIFLVLGRLQGVRERHANIFADQSRG